MYRRGKDGEYKGEIKRDKERDNKRKAMGRGGREKKVFPKKKLKI